ncbi:MAG TPA: hypothetical protein VK731_10080 [Candidatus Cybelea sp.]|jgi:hypothetical protein|nr:hypothetical protein [Candidatus Cybelea sp.]
MKQIVAASFLVMCSGLLCSQPLGVLAQPEVSIDQSKLAADEKEGCIRNLKVIYEAIQNYRVEHKDIPGWLSDLVPQYVNDPNVLTCPVCKRTGEIESGVLADPKIPCSYLYEFCPLQLGKIDAPDNPTKTRREWKQRQMGLVGSIVPIVRCRHHGVVLNLAFDGRIYESPPLWEELLTNLLDPGELKSARIFAGDPSPNTAEKAAPAAGSYPARDPQAKPGLIDLTAYYNAALTDSWHGNSKNDLSSLPSGVQNFAGVDYDVRGIMQLGSKDRAAEKFPTRIDGIKVQQKCARLHFLHSAGFGNVNNEGEQIGSYIVHFSTNRMQLEIPIIYGRDVRNWHRMAGEQPSTELNLAWRGTNGVSADSHNYIRLFTTTWVNVVPAMEIESIDFVSAMGKAAPFLIAITAD